MSNPEPPPYPSGDNSDLPSYGSVPPPPGSGGTPPPPPPPPPGGGVPGWQPPGPTGPAQNQKALIALILGIISVPFMFCCGCIGIGTGAGALACGILGRKEIQASGGAQTGDGMALAGIILGVLGIVVSAVLMLLGVAANFGSFNPNSFTP
jgi:hypothetical protein